MKDLQELKRQGLSISQISSVSGFDRKTVRKYLKEEGATVPQYTPRPERSTKLEPFRPYVEERLSAGVWNAVVLLEELRRRGYTGGYTILKDYLRPLRQQARGVAVRRFETPPGHQAQLDWGELGHIETPEGRRTLYGFAITLGHSRALFADIATDTKIATLLRLHEAAFAELGGVPREILYDRMKTVVLGTDDRGETKWNPLLLDFARYWGFTPRACRAYRPQTKGKVESSIGYLRKNFLCGREASSVPDLRGQLRTWLWQTANQRVHGTTHQRIFAAWQKEKSFLLPLSGRASFPYASEETRKVSRDAYVSFRGNRYSVPWRVAGQEVLLRETDGQLLVHRGGERLAVHLLCQQGAHETVTVAAHHEGIPFDVSERSGGKAKILIHSKETELPIVAIRSLKEYEYE